MGQSTILIEPKTIIVTGAAGFIGAHLVHYLLDRYPTCRIRAVDSLTYAGDKARLDGAFKGGRLDWIEACILDHTQMLKACDGADTLFHLAAESYVGKSFEIEALFYKTNVEGTRSVLSAALSQGVKRVVHFSTDEVYGACYFPASEKDAFAPTSPYARSKVEAEVQVECYRAAGLDIRVLRPSNVVGTGQHVEKLIPKFIDACLRGMPFTLEGSGQQTRTFLPVLDVCHAAALVMEKGERNATYNVPGRETKTVLQIAHMIATACGRSAEFAQISDRPINDSGYPLNGDKLARLGFVQRGALATEIAQEIDFQRQRIESEAEVYDPIESQTSLVPQDSDLLNLPQSIAFHKPYRALQERSAINAVLNSDSFAGGGTQTRQAEQLLEQLTGARHVRLTHSCTAALEIAALALNLSCDDEVIIPAFTFCATATAFAATGARLVFCDIDPKTMMIDLRDFERKISTKTRCVAVVHYGGGYADMNQLSAICAKNNIEIIEDAAQAIGVTRNSKHAGTAGVFGALSFHETKVLQSGNGGALLINTSDPTLLSRIETILNRGTDFEKMRRGEQSFYQWTAHGSSYRPSEFQAALIQAQLQDLPTVLKKRHLLAMRYYDLLAQLDAPFELLNNDREIISNYHCLALLARSENIAEDLLMHLKLRGIHAQRHYAPINSSIESLRRGEYCHCPNTEAAWRRLIRLPIHTFMGLKDVDYVCQEIAQWMIKKHKNKTRVKDLELT